jgi:hypothetical protein
MDKLWFGIPGSHMQFVPCPSIDSVVARNRYVERMQFENGGGDARRSAQYQMEYQFNFSGPAHEVEGIDAFNKFAQGFYGDGLIQLAHPATFETNLFPAAWASPGLIDQGWANIGSTVPDFANTNVSSYGQPPRTATWDVTQQAGTFTKSVTIVIPPTHTLNIGASGVRPSGSTAVVRVVPIDTAGDAGTPVDLTLLSKSSSTRMNATFAGSSFQAVRVYITRTTSAASTISVTSMMAQLYKTGTTPTLPTTHYQGEGSTGLMFVDDAIVETYSYMHPPRKGIATTLVEVGAWR